MTSSYLPAPQLGPIAPQLHGDGVCKTSVRLSVRSECVSAHHNRAIVCWSCPIEFIQFVCSILRRPGKRKSAGGESRALARSCYPFADARLGGSPTTLEVHRCQRTEHKRTPTCAEYTGCNESPQHEGCFMVVDKI